MYFGLFFARRDAVLCGTAVTEQTVFVPAAEFPEVTTGTGGSEIGRAGLLPTALNAVGSSPARVRLARSAVSCEEQLRIMERISCWYRVDIVLLACVLIGIKCL